jgi:predicted  nucleic acid-binding Zn-ribbon protein
MAGAAMDFPQAMPGFLPASEIPRRNLTREEELEEEVRQSRAETMRVLELLGIEQTQSRKPATTGPKPQEWQALQTVISDLLEANVELQTTVKRQAMQIEDLQKAKKELQADIEQIRDCFPRMVAKDRKRIAALENGPDITKNETAKAHIDELYNHMKAIGRKQLSFKDAALCLNLSKSRTRQLKPVIASDERFIILPSESHKQKELIRLSEYSQKDGVG